MFERPPAKRDGTGVIDAEVVRGLRARVWSTVTTPDRASEPFELPVPGVLDIDPFCPAGCRLIAGDDVGYAPRPELDYWVIDAVFVEKSALEAAPPDAAPLPQACLDPSQFGQLLRAAKAARLVWVDQRHSERLGAAGIRRFRFVNDPKHSWSEVRVLGEPNGFCIGESPAKAIGTRAADVRNSRQVCSIGCCCTVSAG